MERRRPIASDWDYLKNPDWIRSEIERLSQPSYLSFRTIEEARQHIYVIDHWIAELAKIESNS